jgi:AcrR family transcriptional regulator
MDNRARILACSLALFADQGYDRVGVQEIVDAAGITKPTLYHYFGSKQGLLETLLCEHFELLINRVRKAADYHGDLPKTITDIVRVLFNFALEYPIFYRLQMALWLAPQNNPAQQAVVRWHQELYQIVQTVFATAVKEHGNMRERQRAYSATLIGMINTYISMALNGYCELNDELILQAVHQFQHGIYS